MNFIFFSRSDEQSKQEKTSLSSPFLEEARKGVGKNVLGVCVQIITIHIYTHTQIIIIHIITIK